MLNCWRESICLLYICIVWYLVVGIVVCKASVLNWLKGLDLVFDVVVCKASMVIWLGNPSAFYIFALYYIRGWSGMQGICCHLAGGLDLAVGVVVCKVSVLDWLGCLDLAVQCSVMQGIYAWLTGESIFLLYICILLYLAFGVEVVCKVSVARVDWVSRSSSQCSVMQGISAWLTGGSICLLYIYALYWI